MIKYIDADRLNADLDKWVEAIADAEGDYSDGVRFAIQHFIFLLASLQQDETQVDKMLCSQVWWEEQGWIMIPPDATIEGIDSLLKQVRKKLQQEQEKSKKDCNDCPHCVDRKDQYGWHFKGCFGGPYKGRFIAEIDECPLKQEQPEVDFEKGLADYCRRYYNYDYPKQAENGTGSSVMPHIIEAAKYFYELGKNSK